MKMNIKKEVAIYFYKSRGPGGQRKNKKETAVKIHHIPTGITVRATEYRSQAKNKELAFERLIKKLAKLKEKKKRRIPTKKPFSVRKREFEEKKKYSEKKKKREKITSYETE